MASIVLSDNEEIKKPDHVAIIMDGNGRWATARGLPRAEGHRKGVAAVRRAVRAAKNLAIKYLTIYAFSSENWLRPRGEVFILMGLLRLFLKSDLADLHKENVKVTVIGSRDGIDEDIVEMIAEAEALTHSNTGLHLVVAFNYGSRDEVSRATQRMIHAVEEGTLSLVEINEHTFSKYLDTGIAKIPDPDLIIRTAGDERLSNFLLWQAAYAELMFLPIMWPDFEEVHLEDALKRFGTRKRRFGALPQVAAE